jgi:hypothetical protein
MRGLQTHFLQLFIMGELEDFEAVKELAGIEKLRLVLAVNIRHVTTPGNSFQHYLLKSMYSNRTQVSQRG